MRGGMVLDNTAGGNGGGVFNADTFRISDGIIFGDDAPAPLANIAGGFGWMSLFNQNLGTLVRGMFNMHGDEISGNTAAGSYGGVQVSGSNSRFFISTGIIHGSNAAAGLRNTATSNWAALSVAFSASAQRGRFNVAGDFAPLGNLASTNG